MQDEIQKATVVERGVEKWFNTVMDHASARFVKHNRLATLTIAILMTIFFRIDSIQIFKQVFSNPELRAKLVNAADGATKQAEEILQRQHLGTQALQDLVAQGKLSASTEASLQKLPLPIKDTCIEGADYLSASIQATEEEVQSFNTICEGKQKAIIGSVGSDIKQLSDRLDSQDLSVFNLVNWRAPWKDLYSEFVFHLRGLILTVLLISLGAPFWFDALKDLVSLRPAVADKIDKETAAAKKPGA